MSKTGRRVVPKKEVIERIKALEAEKLEKTIHELPRFLNERGVTMTELNSYVYPEKEEDKK